jgi:tRNA threonylcarbamoyladenosine biosynthesis protein TsaB
MNLLAIETSSNACSIALMVDDKLFFTHEVAPIQQAKLALPMIQELLTQQNLSLSELDAIAFGCGPGSFTGVRIAASMAQGLAYSANLPLIKVSSLASIAQAVYQELGYQNVLVAIDARMNEIYCGHYALADHGQMELVGQESVVAPNLLIIPVADSLCFAGNAWEIFADDLIVKLPPNAIVHTDYSARADTVASLAKHKWLMRQFVTETSDALPTYLRDNVAKKESER